MLILEGLLTTQNLDGSLNCAPMGPIVAEADSHQPLGQFVFRPFQTSTTFRNLQRSRCGVFHVTDDVLLLVRAVVGELEANAPPTHAAEKIAGRVVTDSCRWYELEVTGIDDSTQRAIVQTRVLQIGHGREWFGFNRARHAVLEAAILATRVGILSEDDIRRQLAAWQPLIEKTGGPREHQAWELVQSTIDRRLQEVSSRSHPSK